MMIPHTTECNISGIVEHAKRSLKVHDYKKMLERWKQNAQVFYELFSSNGVTLTDHFLKNWIQ